MLRLRWREGWTWTSLSLHTRTHYTLIAAAENSFESFVAFISYIIPPDTIQLRRCMRGAQGVSRNCSRGWPTTSRSYHECVCQCHLEKIYVRLYFLRSPRYFLINSFLLLRLSLLPIQFALLALLLLGFTIRSYSYFSSLLLGFPAPRALFLDWY